MKLISVNVGLPREVAVSGKVVRTGIFKEPVQGRVKVRRLNLEGDLQADLTVHGGLNKAVYVYPSEHYPFWQEDLAGIELPWGLAWTRDDSYSWGLFGENFSLEGLLEDQVSVGDRLRIGSAAFQVTTPRMPCYKLGIKFLRADMVERFLAGNRSGFYLSVVEEGEVGAGDGVERIGRGRDGLTVAEAFRLMADGGAGNPDLLRRAVRCEDLPRSWRNQFAEHLQRLGRD
jgi:MOSC domain-containing protein YiiM